MNFDLGRGSVFLRKWQYHNYSKQENLADAKVNARQQCVYEDPWRRNIQQINDMRFAISVCDIFSRTEVESRHLRQLYFNCRLLAEERPAIST